MKKAMFTLILIGLCLNVSAQMNAREREIRKLEALEAEAVLNKDTIALSRLWDKFFVVNSPDNKITNAGKSVSERPALQRTRTKFMREVEQVIF